MKILFYVSHFGFLRNFEPALRLLAQRGHKVHLLADRRDRLGGTRTIDNLTAAAPDAFTSSYVPSRKGDPFHLLSLKLRLSLDYWRYLEPRYDRATSLRARAARQAPVAAVRAAGLPLMGSRTGLALLRAVARRAERALPTGVVPAAVLDELRPDVLLVTPLLYFGSPQVDFVRAAGDRGIPVCHCVGSWDHLTTKGMIHEIPDRMTVWNEMQRREASEIHGVAPERVVVTGAQAYDHWFTQQPSRTREQFCANVGLLPEQLVLLYLCSSPFIAPHEVPFVRRWIAALRGSSDRRIRDANVLIRPHPQNAEQWRDVEIDDPRVAIHPRAGANPVDIDARAEYFDSMFHAVAVVGINTSALIESGIVGRPVCAIQAEDFAGTQEGTLHFQHLKEVNGGLLQLAPTLEVHLEQISSILADPQSFAARSRAFVEAFVRPNGMAAPAAEYFVTAIEALRQIRPERHRRSVIDHVLTRLLAPAAHAAELAAARRKAGRTRKDRGGATA
ncbi:MAG: hypothetical protein ABL971_01325 [Vicinamibacterales bacterium]